MVLIIENGSLNVESTTILFWLSTHCGLGVHISIHISMAVLTQQLDTVHFESFVNIIMFLFSPIRQLFQSHAVLQHVQCVVIVAEWCHMVSQICVNIGSGNGLLPSHYLHQCWPRSEILLIYPQLKLQEQISVKLESKFIHFLSENRILKCRLIDVGHFVQESLC